MNAPILKIVPQKTQKFVLVRVADDDRLVLWGDPAAEWHKDIVVTMEKSGLLIEEVLGGGRIMVLPEDKVIYVWGKSSRYGEFSFSRVRDLLQEEYPSFQIKNEEP